MRGGEKRGGAGNTEYTGRIIKDFLIAICIVVKNRLRSVIRIVNNVTILKNVLFVCPAVAC